MSVWNPATPAGSDPKSQGDDRIRELKVAIQEALQADGGVFPGVTPLSAPVYYPVILKDTDGNKPAASADYPGRMYFNETNGELERVKNDGSAWELLTKSPATRAIHEKVAQSLASVAGIVTLPETANTFVVSGTEAITSIAGWSSGVVRIQWASDRIITYDGTTLLLAPGVSRNVVAGDISTFMFTDADTVVEIAFHGACSGKEIGESFMYNGETEPAGAFEEDGRSLLRADYPGLFAKIGTLHGTADGTHFNIPNSKGRVVRGWDHGAGVDDDAGSRLAGAAGGATGDHVGTKQADAVQQHHHSGYDTQNGITGQSGVGSHLMEPGDTGNMTTGTASTETRMKNVAKMFCIKY